MIQSGARRPHPAPPSRRAAYLGELARAGGHSAVRVAGDGWLAERGHGAALRASCRGPSCAYAEKLCKPMTVVPPTMDTNWSRSGN